MYFTYRAQGFILKSQRRTKDGGHKNKENNKGGIAMKMLRKIELFVEELYETYAHNAKF